MHEDAHQIPTTVVRRATREDAAHACQVVVRSVREICAKDYGHDQALLARWCANKTVETVTEWILHPAHYFLVAEVPPHGIVGVGLLDVPKGEVVLCYIVPEVLYQGVGKRLLTAMEQQARALGRAHVCLESSITARDFYLRNGYHPNGAPTHQNQITAFPMIKHFADQQPSHTPSEVEKTVEAAK